VKDSRKRAVHVAIAAAAAVGFLVPLYLAKHLGAAAQLATMFFFACAMIASVVALRTGLRWWRTWRGGEEATPWVDRFALAMVAAVVGLVLAEAYLWMADELELGRRAGAAIPEEWRRETVEVEGAEHAHRWHGHLFVFDENGFRRTTPFPPRQPELCRVLIFGDSLTYGYGVATGETYPARLQALLEANCRVEVLNLGVSGASSEDVRASMARWVPELEPDLVVYGVCLNDFLPRGVAEYRTPPFPLIPIRLKVFVASRTRLGLLVRDSYQNLLINLGFEHDFYDDILKDFGSYRTRFADDLQAMNHAVISQGLAPVVLMVVEQRPAVDGKGHRISREVEMMAAKADMTVVGIDTYVAAHDGEVMAVSEWEGHPNERAHELFAELLAPVLADHPALERCSR
jgi:lysophospholipase L1-like esterase